MVLAWENLQEAFVILVVAVVFDFTRGFSFHCFSTSFPTLDQLKCFCGMVDRRKRLALFPAGTIVRYPHHREFLTSRDQGLNLRRTCAQA